MRVKVRSRNKCGGQDSELEEMNLIPEWVVNEMQQTMNPDLLALLGSALGQLGVRLPAEHAKVGALRLWEE